MNAEEWLKTLQMAVKLMDMDDEQKLMFLIQTRLRDKATIWWVSEKNAYYDEKKDTERLKLPSLEVFMTAFKKEYMGADERRRWLQKFSCRRQKWEETVEEFLAALKDLKARSGYQVLPDMMLVQFIEGLRPRIRDQVKVQKPESLREASDRAILAEEILRKNKRNQKGSQRQIKN